MKLNKSILSFTLINSTLIILSFFFKSNLIFGILITYNFITIMIYKLLDFRKINNVETMEDFKKRVKKNN
jgi:hypothetical protein